MHKVKIQSKIEEIKKELFHPENPYCVGSSHLKTVHLSDCQLHGFLLEAGGSPSQFFPPCAWPEAQAVACCCRDCYSLLKCGLWLFAPRNLAVVF